ncbi:MAG: hypothetical protein V7L21_35055 [Nostoc sp.]|uniref:hypothetical protein n=1 Tax=unclassified Nostoc TaxID=2593658 RepID=UPI0025F33865|nr:hypothetical protein [Nostoc sp. NMS9]MBN3942142.1 hypothetical protein [Nostoc sp. NMS9]
MSVATSAPKSDLSEHLIFKNGIEQRSQQTKTNPEVTPVNSEATPVNPEATSGNSASNLKKWHQRAMPAAGYANA